jgi:LCP family protein required for cell wall assembly
MDQKPKFPPPAFSAKEIAKPPLHKKAALKSLLKKFVRTIPTSKTEFEQKKVPFFFLVLFTLLSGLVIFKVAFTSYQYLTTFDLKDLFGLISSDMVVDDKKRTNVLLLGVGGGEHDGADLTDTIMIASFHQENHTASLASIPRDLWLDLPGYGSSRINKIYDTLKGEYGSTQALDILRKGVENISNLDIPYVIKVDFAGFRNIVDTLGGIEITVEKSIYDTQYPKDDQSGYETFSLEAGTQILDGEIALKFARSRHSSSDFDRSNRQQIIIEGIKKKAQETNFLSSPLLIKKLYQEFSDHLETNLRTTELISLARLVQNIDEGDIASIVLINNEILDVGSFLYTPLKELYGGAFVLVPVDNSYEKIQRFFNIAFDYPRFFSEKASIEILNGTKKSGLAAQFGQKMIPYGFNIQHYRNAERRDYSNTVYYIRHPEKTQTSEEVLKSFFPGAEKIKEDPLTESDDDISIVLGEDSETPKW